VNFEPIEDVDFSIQNCGVKRERENDDDNILLRIQLRKSKLIQKKK